MYQDIFLFKMWLDNINGLHEKKTDLFQGNYRNSIK